MDAGYLGQLRADGARIAKAANANAATLVAQGFRSLEATEIGYNFRDGRLSPYRSEKYAGWDLPLTSQAERAQRAIASFANAQRTADFVTLFVYARTVSEFRATAMLKVLFTGFPMGAARPWTGRATMP